MVSDDPKFLKQHQITELSSKKPTSHEARHHRPSLVASALWLVLAHYTLTLIHSAFICNGRSFTFVAVTTVTVCWLMWLFHRLVSADNYTVSQNMSTFVFFEYLCQKLTAFNDFLVCEILRKFGIETL